MDMPPPLPLLPIQQQQQQQDNDNDDDDDDDDSSIEIITAVNSEEEKEEENDNDNEPIFKVPLPLPNHDLPDEILTMMDIDTHEDELNSYTEPIKAKKPIRFNQFDEDGVEIVTIIDHPLPPPPTNLKNDTTSLKNDTALKKIILL